MVVALFALSLVMIVGGAAAVVQGFPYVRLESGLAMVIGGTTAASAGAVLLGLAAVLLQIRKLADRRERGAGDTATIPLRRGVVPVPADAVPTAPAYRPSVFEETPPVSTVPVATTAGAGGLAGIGPLTDRLGTSDSRPADDAPLERTVEMEPPLPDLLPPASRDPGVADDDLFTSNDAPGEPHPGAGITTPGDMAEPDPAQEELALRPSFVEPQPAVVPESVPPAAGAKAEPAVEEAPRHSEEMQVVGTYASGANTYVMFANGTIQADTPRGQFTFQSLDELKVFVDSGGETNARGAA